MQYNKEISKKLGDIENDLVNISALINVICDSCTVNYYTDQEIALKLTLKKLYNVTEDISNLY